jgi:uncharacterized protein DUF6573
MTQEKPTREQEVEEGKQRDISEQAKNAGLMIPVFITSTVWEAWVTPDQKSTEQGENESARLNNILDKLVYYMRMQRQTNRSNLIYFPVPLTKEGKSGDVQLLSHLGPLDVGVNKPCITIMAPEEYESQSVN